MQCKNLKYVSVRAPCCRNVLLQMAMMQEDQKACFTLEMSQGASEMMSFSLKSEF